MIGAAVVLLLLIILVVTYFLYRIRKKDEVGSTLWVTNDDKKNGISNSFKHFQLILFIFHLSVPFPSFLPHFPSNPNHFFGLHPAAQSD